MEKEPTSAEKIKFVVCYISRNGMTYDNQLNEKNIDPVYYLYKNDKPCLDLENIKDGMVYSFYGIYYVINGNQEKAMEMYDKGIELKHGMCFFNKASKKRKTYFIEYVNMHMEPYEGSDDWICASYARFLSENMHKNIEQSIKYLKTGSDAGGRESTVKLGDEYYYGYNMEKNLGKAYELYSKAADLGSISGLRSIAYINIAEKKQDIEKNLEMMETAANMHDVHAIALLAEWYHTGEHGIPINIERSLELTKMLFNMSKIKYRTLLRLIWNNGSKKEVVEMCYTLNSLEELENIAGATTGKILLDYHKDNIEIRKQLNEATQKIKELEDVNEHLKLFPGTSYEQAMKDYELLSISG